MMIESSPPDKAPDNIPLVMGGVMLGLLLAALDGTIVSTIMPTIAGQLHGMGLYVWPFTVYMLTSTIAIIVFGKLSDIYGRKIIFNLGILIFLVGSILSGISPDMISLILFRAIQGAGGGIIMTVAFIMVAELFPIWLRGKYLGILASVFGIASIIGPALGGLITETIGWPWVFYINIPIGIISLVMIQRWFPDITPIAQSREIDYHGIITFIIAMIPLFLGLSFAGSVFAWTSPQTIGLLAGSILLFALFIRTQISAKEPILALRLFKNKVFSIAMLEAFLSNSLFIAAIIYIPLFVQEVLKQSASMAGMVITPMVVAMVLAAMITGQMIARRRRYKNLAICGFMMIGMSMIIYALIQPDTSLGILVVASILMGYGSGIMHPLLSIAAQNAFTHKEIGVITSSLQFSRNMGATIITPIFGVIMYGALNMTGSVDLSSISPTLLTHAISIVFIACIVITGIALVITFLLEDTEIKPRDTPAPQEQPLETEVASS